MARPDKAAAVAELKNKFTSSNGAVLTEYRGLSVAELRDLRRSLGEDASYAVSKNTLTQIAAREAGIEDIDDKLVGPTAIAFIDGDPVTVAKGLRDFAKANPLLVIKGGVLDGRTIDAAEVNKLADLESRETLLAKMAGALKGSLSNAASLFNAPLSQAARVVAALEAKAQEDPSVIAGAGSAPAAEADSAPEATQADAAPAAEDTPAADAAEEN
ncbi:50S ribosomal protein L10 [Microlunatus soli]|uniref:Large ribosomal subunit protein uL10 n=1 Tax=Microlunatus soli TaxID=630515 RepID=A0A1H1WHZ0_9ACTN|nr:50S ribosomal protein L10 [Microlunatus soli]SDS96270.1 LSU ribosomal protein L10P [Microlunatus soli]